MKIEPGMISDEAVEAAVAAYRALPAATTFHDSMHAAITAAMNVMLGGPVAWMYVYELDGTKQVDISPIQFAEAWVQAMGAETVNLFALNNGEKQA